MRRIWQLMWLPAIILLLMSTGVVGCGPSPVTMATAVPPDAAGVLDTPQAYLERGDLRADRKDYQMAIAGYTQAIELRPTFAEAFDNRGYAHYWSYQAALAIDDYSRAIELRPNYPFAYNNRGAARMAGGHGCGHR